MKTFKARASSLHEIMATPKEKKNLISKTAITHLNDWVDSQIFHRRKSISTWAMSKGIEKEHEARIIVNKFLGTNLKKDTRHFEDEYLTGHIDIDYAEKKTVFDIKICETFSTFPRFKEEVENAYYWQMQAYMHLMNYEKAVVIKVLVNSPVWQIQSLMNKASFSLLNKYGETNEQYQSEFEEEVKNIFAQHVFDKQIKVDGYELTEAMIIPTEGRVKLFEVERCQEDIDRIAPRVIDCRKFLKQQGF